MAITTLAAVKTAAELYNRTQSGAPTTATSGVVGDMLMDTATGKTYELTSITTGPTVYNWTEQTAIDTKINAKLTRVEQDYLAIRGLPFDKDALDATVYPTGASDTAAEMVCYLLELGRYQGRGNTAETEDKIQKTYDMKWNGYPLGIVGCIERFQRVQ